MNIMDGAGGVNIMDVPNVQQHVSTSSNPLTCPSCETGTLTLCTGLVLSEPKWAENYSIDWALRRRGAVEPFLSCDACEWARRTSDVIAGRVL